MDQNSRPLWYIPAINPPVIATLAYCHLELNHPRRLSFLSCVCLFVRFAWFGFEGLRADLHGIEVVPSQAGLDFLALLCRVRLGSASDRA